MILPLAGGSAVSTDPKSAVVRLQDVPAGFMLASAGYRSNTAVAGVGNVTLAELNGVGRVSGYRVDFVRPIGLRTSPSGAIVVSSIVAVYTSTTGASKEFRRREKTCTAATSKQLRAIASGSPQVCADVGDFTLLRHGVRSKLRSYVIVWQRRNLIGAVLVAGLRGRVAPQQAIPLVKTQDERMR